MSCHRRGHSEWQMEILVYSVEVGAIIKKIGTRNEREKIKRDKFKGGKGRTDPGTGRGGGQTKKYDTLIRHCKYEENIPELLKLVT